MALADKYRWTSGRRKRIFSRFRSKAKGQFISKATNGSRRSTAMFFAVSCRLFELLTFDFVLHVDVVFFLSVGLSLPSCVWSIMLIRMWFLYVLLIRFLSRAPRPISHRVGRLVGRSVHPSVGLSQFAFLHFNRKNT